MRLRQVNVDKYGSFERLRLDFETRPGCINLVVAPNGAGKSVLREALQNLLYPAAKKQTAMKFRYSYSDMKLEAEAVTRDGEGLSFGWSRKPGRTYGAGEGHRAEGHRAEGHRAEGHRARLDAVLDWVTEAQAERLFSLDTARLRTGGQELASGGDTLGTALLAGTGELSSARKVRAALQARQDTIWEKRKSSLPLNRAAKALQDARTQARAAVHDPVAWARQSNAVKDQRRVLEDARSRYDIARKRARQLARVDRTRPDLAKLDEATGWLLNNPDASVLDDDLRARLGKARERVALAAPLLRDKAEAAERHAATLAGLVLDQVALDAKPELDRLPGRRGAVLKGRDDLVERRAELVAAEAAVADLVREVGSDLPAGEAGSLVPESAVIAEARDLIERAGAAQLGREAALSRLVEATAEVARLEAVPAADLGDAGPLQRLKAEVLGDGDPLKRAREAAGAVRTARASVEAALLRVPGAAGALDGEVPAEAMLLRLDDRCRVAGAALEAARKGVGVLGERIAAWRRTLARIESEDVPDGESVRDARARRDEGWRVIALRLFGTADEASEAGYAGEDALPIAFERDLRRADVLADRSLAEADRVAEANQLRRDLAEAMAPLADATQAAADAALTDEAAQDGWAQAVQALGLAPHVSLADVRATLDARQEAQGLLVKLRAMEDDAEALGALHAGWAGRLGALLDGTGDLAAMLERAEQRLAALGAANDVRIAWETRVATALRARIAAATEAKTAAAAWDTWAAGWAALLPRLRRPAGEAPVATAAVLDRLNRLQSEVRKAADLRHRIVGIERDSLDFDGQVRVLADRLGMAADAGALIRRGEAAQERSAERAITAKGQAGAARSLAEAEAESREAQGELLSVLTACGAVDVAEADRRLELARERLRHEGQRDTAERGLVEAGDGLPHGALREEAALFAQDSMAVERERAEEAQAEASKAAQEAAVKLRGLEDSADAMAVDTAARDTAHEQAAAAARFGALLDDFLVLHVAGAMLGRAVEAMEQGSGQKGLRRISEAFAVTSGGTHTIVGEENEKGETVLRAIEHRYPAERRRIHELSEGLRDQLYLALRLVAIEDHVAGGPGLPFVADDILQTFDDGRALASLRGLVALSRHVQVIVLTHHEHIAELARGLGPDAVHVQRLAA